MAELKTREQVRRDFDRHGKSIAAWAKSHGFSVPNTYLVLRGKNKGLRGQSHRIAVLLGIKDGIV